MTSMLASIFVTSMIYAAADLPQMPALAATGEKDEPGLTLTLESLAPNAAKLPFHDTRIARLPSLYVPRNSSPSIFAAPGPFRATFEGDLNLRLRDFFTFLAEGNGKLTLKFNDQVVLQSSGDDLSKTRSDEVRLNKGKNPFVCIYESGIADASFRLLWIPKGQAPEPIPPNILTHDGADPSLREGQRLREGRFLVAQFRCAQCHSVANTVTENPHDAMPELSQDAPSFKDIGARLNADWMAAWINNPRAMRARSHMPRVFRPSGDANAIDPRARDVASYLATLGSRTPAEQALDIAKVEAGGRIFTNLNCVACHISPERSGDPAPGADEGRIALSHVKAKFKPAALKQFLLKPEAHYAWIAMPNFRLSDDEADGLAAYLLANAKDQIAAGPSTNAQNGQKLLNSSGCLNCHTMDDKGVAATGNSLAAAFDAIPKAGWSRGCMATGDANRKNAPDFAVSDDQRNAILAFAATDRSSPRRDSAMEFAQRQMMALRCNACHGRDGRESLLASVLDAENQELKGKYPPIEQAGGEGIAPDQRAPILTWAGEKLRPQWMEQFIAGGISYKPRYYLLARMPGFASRASKLSEGMAYEHGFANTYPAYPPANPQLAAVGQKLAGTTPNESLSCIRCHAVANQPAQAPFEAPAPNFMHATDRLRQEYYYRWMRNPLRVDPETKMPQFDFGDGKTGITAILDGDAHKQFEALWHYMLTGKDIKPAQ
jgi:mono/diheme cytochrome c family protein